MLKKASQLTLVLVIFVGGYFMFDRVVPPQFAMGSINASSTTLTSSGYREWTVSANACQTSIAVWGGGGGGATGASGQGGGGGGGGGFASSTITTTPGQIIRMFIAPSTALEVSAASTTASTTAPTMIAGASGGKALLAAVGAEGGKGNVGDVAANGGNGGSATTGTGDESGGGGGAGGPGGVGGNGGSCTSSTVGCGGGGGNGGGNGTDNTVTPGAAGTNGGIGGTGDDGATAATVGADGTYGGGGGGGPSPFHGGSVSSSSPGGGITFGPVFGAAERRGVPPCGGRGAPPSWRRSKNCCPGSPRKSGSRSASAIRPRCAGSAGPPGTASMRGWPSGPVTMR